MDFDKVVGGLSRSGVLGGLAGGALGGALVSNKKARKSAGTLLKAGGVAALGALAWKAYQGYQVNRAEPAQHRPGQHGPGQHHGNGAAAQRDPVWDGLTEQRFAIETDGSEKESPALLLVQAMVTAANADGHIDRDERRRVFERTEALDLPAEEKALVLDVLSRPLTMVEICERVDTPELATEVYLSSMLAVDTSEPEARVYLDGLAFRLGLPKELVAELRHQCLQEEKLTAAA